MLVLALSAVILTPLAIAATRSSRPISMGYIALLVVIAFCGTGLLAPGKVTSVQALPVTVGRAQTEQCTRVLQLIEEAGITIDQTDPSSPKLIGQGMESLPPEAREAIVACAKTAPKAAR